MDQLKSATSIMNENTLLPFDLPSVARKKLTVGFDGGQLSSDTGVLLLRGAEKRIGICARLAASLRDRRNPESIEHPLEEMIKLRTKRFVRFSSMSSNASASIGPIQKSWYAATATTVAKRRWSGARKPLV